MNTDTLILLISAVVLVLLVGAGLAVTGAADHRKAQRRIQHQRTVAVPDPAEDSPPPPPSPAAAGDEAAVDKTAEVDEPQ